jgi:outer membrane protein assembly factor BamA
MYIRTIASLVLLVAYALTATATATAAQSSDPPLEIERLECRGNANTSCTYILSYLFLSPGGAVDEEEIRNAKFRLSALPNFTSVRIFLERGTSRGKAKVIVEVVEANPLSTEAVAGLANHRDNMLGLRIGHHNLFGAGELLELTATARFPVDGPIEREVERLRLQYVDPMLLGSERWFLTAGAGHFRDRYQTEFDDSRETHETGVDFQVGRRIADFSYLAVGYRYLFTGSFDEVSHKSGGVVDIDHREYSHQLLLDYGWNSEDDPYFPTRGGRLRLSAQFMWADRLLLSFNQFSTEPDVGVGDDDLLLKGAVAYRHTWAFHGGNYLHFRLEQVTGGTESRSALDEDEGYTLGYERTLPPGLFAGVERGRWYVHVKDFFYGVNSGNDISEVGVRVGVRLDTRQFGIVELYLQATTEH